MHILNGSSRFTHHDADGARNGSSVSTLPSSISAKPSATRSVSALEPEAAVAIWDAAVAAAGPSFFEGYPRDGGRTGVFDDEEKVRMVCEVLTSDIPDFDGDTPVVPRAQVIRDTARRLGFAVPQPQTFRNLPAGSLGTMMMLGMTLVGMLADGRLTEETLDAQPALWFHGAKSPLTGDPTTDRAFVRSVVAWARCGFPRVVLASHRLAASMIWIDATRGLEDVRPPWEAFWISIPNNLVRYDSGRGTVDVTEGFVHVRPSGAVIARFGDSASLGLQVLRPSLATLGDTEGIAPDWVKEHADHAILSGLVECVEPARDTVAAATEMLANLVLSVCVDMTAHRPAPRARRMGKPNETPTTEPTCTDYIIDRRAVHVGDPGVEDVNCINAVREYVCDPDRRQTGTTQRIHRAHYQMQTHGPRSSLRRLQLHRAYRQGPADAPVAVRPHVRGSRS